MINNNINLCTGGHSQGVCIHNRAYSKAELTLWAQ